jgi:heat-inducible transcriptional repressor
MSSKRSMSSQTNERSNHILKLLIEKYIDEGQPVASKTLVNECQLGVSSATIRNVLSDLENRGYLRSPHTSAGRVPTEQGYRLFVDHLLTVSDMDTKNIRHLESALTKSSDPKSLAESASQMLSELTQLTGIVMVPSSYQETLRHIEFLPLNTCQILVILVLNEKEVQNFVIDVDRSYSDIELNQATNFVNQTFAGQALSTIRKRLLDLMEREKESLSQMMEATIQVSSKALQERKREDNLVIKGESHLLAASSGADLGQLKSLFEAFSQKKVIIDMLDRCTQSNGLQIFIGKESGYKVFDDLTLITAPYSVGKDVIGVLAVVGPTRIPYQKVIPAVDMTAKILASVLNQNH